MDSNYDVDTLLSQHRGQILALFNAVMALIDLHSEPDEFASRDRLADLSRTLDEFPEAMRSHGKVYVAANHQLMCTALREMSGVLLDHAENRRNNSDSEET